jgi:hypothetical protein
LTPNEIAIEFQKRRKKWILVSVACGCVSIPVLFTFSSLEGVGLSIGTIALVLSLTVWTIFTLTYYTCPKCGMVPFTFYGQGGIILDPDICLECKSTLKPQNL